MTLALFEGNKPPRAPKTPSASHRSLPRAKTAPGQEQQGQSGGAAPAQVGAARLAQGYELSREWTTPENLCAPHVETRIADGWSVKPRIGPWPVWLDCGDCNRELQAAPGYATPTVVPALIGAVPL